MDRRAGPTAALSTLEKWNRNQILGNIEKKGKIIKDEWKDIARSTNFDINISGLDAIPKFSILDKNSNAYKTFITQEMLKKNILATNMIFVSISHSDRILDKYFKELKKVFKRMKSFKINCNIKEKLDNEEAWNSFKRYN